VTTQKHILVCQHLTCRKQGAAKVLAALKSTVIPDGISYAGCSCLGQCGNGPNALILPDRIWYYRVTVDDIPTIIARLQEDD
jgi:(2Fe-2S) ferredoxin